MGGCNLKCKYCGNSEEFLSEKVTDENMVLNAIRQLQPKQILFTGGEVYLNWKLLIKILNLLPPKQYDYILSSNLTLLTQDDLDLLIDTYGFKIFHTSFNDLDPKMTKTIWH